MSCYNQFWPLRSDDLSVEVNSDGFSLNNDSSSEPLQHEFNSLFDVDFLNGFDIAGVCDSGQLAESIERCDEPNEFDKYLGSLLSLSDDRRSRLIFRGCAVPSTLISIMKQLPAEADPTKSCSLNRPQQIIVSYWRSDPTSDIDQNLLLCSNLPVGSPEKVKKVKTHKKPIALSSCVGVGVPQRLLQPSYKIELVYNLEEKFRPRYKSDYFGQNGKIRKPRYVTDRQGSHYITLKMPVGVRGKIRIDWLTVANGNQERYFMPYQFQADNESSDVPDCNPIYEDIKCDDSGIMKVYLVLIKAKQDSLKSLQPLKPFHPFRDAFGMVDKGTVEKTMKLTPKKLIQKYQLNKSQLAFTVCTLGTDGQTCIPEWDTTVFSTILEEAGDNPTTKTISCPKCSCSITINDETDTDAVQETITNKRKPASTKTEKLQAIKKQRSLSDEILNLN